MLDYRSEDLTPEQIAAEHSVHGPLAEVVRELVDACVRTEVDAAEVDAVRDEVAELVRRLQVRQMPGSFGVRVNSSGLVRNHGNAVVGLRNPIAPPLRMQRSTEGRAWADFHLGAAYEGPPGLVHGGVTALILDQVCGEAAAAGGAPGMTGTLNIRYRRGTPLGPLHAEASIASTDGVKTKVTGSMSDADGVTVECEGLFILPRWAREALARDGAKPTFE